MQTRAIHTGSSVRVVEYRCDARRGDRPFEEEHKGMCIALVRRGVFTYRTEGARTVLGPGDLLLGNPQQSYECLHEHTNGDLCVSFEFAPAALDSVVATLNIKKPRLRAPSGSTKNTLTMSVVKNFREPNADEFGLELLAQLLSEPDAPTPIAITAPQQRRIGDVLALMDESASSHLCLDDFAALARLSPYHFVRVFRAHVGTTPHQYLTRLRLMRSAEQLVESEDSVMEIALACGFRDLSNFMYAFKRAFGHSPGNYRTARKSKTH